MPDGRGLVAGGQGSNGSIVSRVAARCLIPAGHRLVAATSVIFAVSGISRDNPTRGYLNRELFAPVAQPDRATDF